MDIRWQRGELSPEFTKDGNSMEIRSQRGGIYPYLYPYDMPPVWKSYGNMLPKALLCEYG